MRGRICFSLSLFLIALTSFASVNPVNLPPETQHLSQDVDGGMSEVDKELNRTRKDLNEKVKMFHRIQNGAKAPTFVWQKFNENSSKQSQALPYLKFEIREILRKIENLQIRREEIKYESELQQVGNTLSIENATIASSTPFICSVLPSKPANDESLVIDQGFGPTSDKDTGLKWKSSGWWVRRGEGWVRACADGKIAFEGMVQGRGRVVMIDHGRGVLSLYANLSEVLGAENPNRKGKTLKAGDVIGPVDDKFYFEVRQGGIPIDPKLVLTQESLSKISL